MGIFIGQDKFGNYQLKLGTAIGAIVIFVIALICLMSCWVIVPSGHVGVQVYLGEVQSEEFAEGFHTKNPLVGIEDMSVRTQPYTMSIAHSEGQRTGDDSIVARSKDGLNVGLDITILYKLDPKSASDIYQKIGEDYAEVIVRPQIRTVIREVVKDYNATDIYAKYREDASLKIEEKLVANMGNWAVKNKIEGEGILIQSTLIRNIGLPKAIDKAIEEKLAAEQEAQKMQFVLQKEGLEAERKLVEAKGIKNAMEEIKQELTPEYNQYLAIQAMQELVGSQNTVFYFIPTSDNGMGIPLVLEAQQ
jgi:regulator of protease activity HflC (stomatin/prohibitin superfamily)